MNDVRMVTRSAPVILEDEDDMYGWDEANRRKARPNPIQWVRLLFRPWRTLLAPRGTRCAVTTMGGVPVYQYKELNGKVYYLGPEPSPGFPGS